MRFGLASRLGIVLALSGMLSAGITAFQAQRASETLLVDSAHAELLTSTRVLARRITLVREDLSRTLLALARHPAALAALADDAQAATQLATLFALPMEANRAYFQIRLIGAADNGLERVRIDRDGDAPLRVDGDALQEKGHYPYVFDTLALAAGEVYMSRAGFAELNRRDEEAGREPFMNPRNAAAGSLKQLDPREVATRPLDAVIYALGHAKGLAFPSHGGMLKQFADWGFKTPPWQRLCVDIRAVLAAIDELEILRHSFPFEIDGAVVKVNRRDLYAQFGATAKSPRWARAFKYEPERAETRIWQITVQVGRTGVLTPVAELDPVLLAGSEIARATLHNADEIARKDIRVGDRVWVVKAGDVIPAIESVLAEKRDGSEAPFVMPSACPECGGPVVRLGDEVAQRCTNPACPAQRIGRLEHFASRDALDIRAIGGKVAEALVAQGWVKDPLDLFALTLPQLEAFRIGDEACGTRKFGKNAQTAMEALACARTLPLDRWLFATGIPNVGVTVAEQIASGHATFSELSNSPVLSAVLRLVELYDAAALENPRSTLNRPQTDAQRQTRQERHNRICGEIGVTGDLLVAAGVATKTPGTSLPPLYSSSIKPEAAKSVLAFFASDYGRAYLARLRALGIDPQSKPRPAAAENAALAGVTFVLTGTLSKPRSEFAALIKSAGGVVQDAVSKNTRYLVAGADAGATKINKARNLGTEVIDEHRLESLLSGMPTTPPDAERERGAPPAPSNGFMQQELF